MFATAPETAFCPALFLERGVARALKHKTGKMPHRNVRDCPRDGIFPALFLVWGVACTPRLRASMHTEDLLERMRTRVRASVPARAGGDVSSRARLERRCQRAARGHASRATSARGRASRAATSARAAMSASIRKRQHASRQRMRGRAHARMQACPHAPAAKKRNHSSRETEGLPTSCSSSGVAAAALLVLSFPRLAHG